MKMLRNRIALSLLLAASVLVLTIHPLCAKEKGVEIDADSVHYDKSGSFVEASGSVEARYKNVKIKSSHIKYYSENSRVVADEGFSLSRDNIDIVGRKLDYFLKTQSGSAESVRLSMGNTWASGESVTIDPEVVDLKDASFSSCDLLVPHYKIASSDMAYYFNTGWIVESWGMFYLNNLPVLPVPTYVYDTGAIGGMYSKRNPAPLPDIGSNDVDGTYLDEKIVWRITNYSYGMLDLGYATKKGGSIGFEGNYFLNDQNEGRLRVFTSQNDGGWGGISHTYYFGDPIISENTRQLLYQILDVPPRRKYSVTVDTSWRERINYERISYLPLVTLHYIDVPFPVLNFTPRVEVSLGSISEESTGLHVFKGQIRNSLDYLHPVGTDSLLFGLDNSYAAYDSSSSWFSILGRVDYKKKLSDPVEVSAGYSHYFINNGASPFRYENYRYFPYDEIRAGITLRSGDSSVGLKLSYNSPLLTVRDIDYNATIGLHCFDLGLTYRAARGEFEFNLSLASRSDK